MKQFICDNCKKSFTRKERKGVVKHFCSKECFYQYKASHREVRHCQMCGKELNKFNKKFCCNQCQKDFESKQFIESWLDGNETGLIGKRNELSRYIETYLFKIHNNSCERCGWNAENSFTHKVPLEIHHKDGNHLNNHFDNLELLCPNCHSLTENYGSRQRKFVGRRTKYWKD